MILLVVGLVAVIVVILIAVFLSIRLGRGDEHDDEPDIRSGSRDQRAEEDHWREPGGRDARRSSPYSRAAGRGAGERHGSADDDRRRGGEPAYSGARERTPARRASDRDYEEGSRRPARRDAPDYESSPARRSAAPASPGSRGRRDEAPPPRAAADDFPSADYGSMDLASDNNYRSREREYAADDFPSEELPAAPARRAKRPAARAGRPDSRSNAAPAPAPSKSRSRQRGKRDDTDDWPSSEWDKLSDEQYWAELSADNPLASMARPSKPLSLIHI